MVSRPAKPGPPVIGTHEGEKFNIWPSTDFWRGRERQGEAGRGREREEREEGRGRKRRPLDAFGDDKREGEGEGRCRARQIKSEQPAASLFTEGYLRH